MSTETAARAGGIPVIHGREDVNLTDAPNTVNRSFGAACPPWSGSNQYSR
jgi:hypothetical protein